MPNRKHMEEVAIEFNINPMIWSELNRNAKIVKEYQRRMKEYAMKKQDEKGESVSTVVYLSQTDLLPSSRMLADDFATEQPLSLIQQKNPQKSILSEILKEEVNDL
uniref:MADF domain-containing protein n=1 Tax=Elaeophora elaphi TaxID=1147741 RepID=A0A0R3RX68_9BILA